jgi:hypothetical protein
LLAEQTGWDRLLQSGTAAGSKISARIVTFSSLSLVVLEGNVDDENNLEGRRGRRAAALGGKSDVGGPN